MLNTSIYQVNWIKGYLDCACRVYICGGGFYDPSGIIYCTWLQSQRFRWFYFWFYQCLNAPPVGPNEWNKVEHICRINNFEK